MAVASGNGVNRMDDRTRDLFAASFRLKRVQYRKSAAVDAALLQIGSSLAQWALLRDISQHPGETARALAQRTRQTDQALGALIVKLAERGLVERTPGRGKALRHELTETGRRMLDQCTPVVAEVLSREFGRLDDEELATFVALLGKIAGDEA